MWRDLDIAWQAAFEEAWTAFCRGSVPIGAALFDENGRPVGRDRNRCAEAGVINRRIAHAEANVLRHLDTDMYPDPRSMKLYTTMEPCPMCLGTIVMANIRDLSYAAADTYCGAVHMLEEDPYMRGKHMRCRYMGGEHELFQLTLQSCFEMKRVEAGSSDKVLEHFRKTDPAAVAIAEKLYRDGLPDRWNGKMTAGEVFDAVCAMR